MGDGAVGRRGLLAGPAVTLKIYVNRDLEGISGVFKFAQYALHLFTWANK